MGLVAHATNSPPVVARHAAAVLTSKSPPGYLSGMAFNTVPYTPGGKTIVVAGHTAAAIDTAIAAAVAVGPGSTVSFPGGVYPHGNGLVQPDGINFVGQGIYDQQSHTGTWLQCSITWGSNLSTSNMLIGNPVSSNAGQFHPVARGSSAAGSDTHTNGSHDVTFNFVR